jgi:hypothetical protein
MTGRLSIKNNNKSGMEMYDVYAFYGTFAQALRRKARYE